MRAIEDRPSGLPTRRPWRSLLRGGRNLLLAVGAVWAVWLVAVHAFLWTPLLRSILERHKVHLRYSFAWSPWPGRVHVSDLVLQAQDEHFQWRLQIDSAWAVVALTDLPRRIFHTTSVEADGLTFGLRARLPRAKLTPHDAYGLPPMEAFGPAPYAEDVAEEQVPDWDYRKFSVWLQGVRARGIRQLWIEKVRLDGDARAEGAFYLKPGREILLQPGELWTEGLTASVADERVADGIRGHLLLRLARLDPRKLKKPVLIRAADADAEFTGRMVSLSALSVALPGQVTVEGGTGPARLSLHVQAGQVLPHSELDLKIKGTTIRSGPLWARAGEIAIALGPSGEVSTGDARASVVLTQLEAGREAHPPVQKRAHLGATKPTPELLGEPAREAISAEGFSVVAVGHSLDLAALQMPRTATVELHGGKVDDARALVAMFGPAASSKVQIDSGSVGFGLRLSGPPDALAGKIGLAVKSGQARVDGLVIRADTTVDLNVRAFDPLRGADLSDTRVAIRHARLINPGGEEDTAPDWWGQFHLPRAQLRVPQAAKGGPMLDADLTGECRDARPIVGLYVRRKPLPGIVAGLFNLDELRLKASLLAGRETIALRGLDAEGRHGAIRGVLLKDDDGTKGAALLTVRGLSVAIGVDGKHTSVHPLIGAGSWFADRQRELQPDQALPQLPRARRAQSPTRAPVVQTAD